MWWHTRRNQISSFTRKGRVHLNLPMGRQLSRLLAAELCPSAVVILDTPCSEVVWRVLATFSIRQFPLHFPSLRHRVPSHFNWTLPEVQHPCLVSVILRSVSFFVLRTCNFYSLFLVSFEAAHNGVVWQPLLIDTKGHLGFDLLWPQGLSRYKDGILTATVYVSDVCNYIMSGSRIRLCLSCHSSADGSHVGRKLWSRKMESTSSWILLLPGPIPVPISAQKFWHSGWHRHMFAPTRCQFFFCYGVRDLSLFNIRLSVRVMVCFQLA